MVDIPRTLHLSTLAWMLFYSDDSLPKPIKLIVHLLPVLMFAHQVPISNTTILFRMVSHVAKEHQHSIIFLFNLCVGNRARTETWRAVPGGGVSCNINISMSVSYQRYNIDTTTVRSPRQGKL